MSPAVIIAILCVAGAGLLAVMAIRTGKKGKSGKKGIGNSRFSLALINFYNLLNQYGFLRSLIQPIRRRLEFYSDMDERTIRKKTVAVFLIAIWGFALSMLLFWIITKDPAMLLIFGLVLIFMVDAVVDIFVTNIHTRLLKQQLHYHELLRHKYYEMKSVEDANYEACSELNKKDTFEIYTQAERINDIISARDTESSLENYYDTAPNKYLKLLAGMIYMTKEYGDTQIDGGSVFIKGIGHLSNEIRAEVFKREKLKYALRSLNVIAILPVFFIKPIREWAGSNFAPLENFYAGRLGIILAIVTVVVAFIAYMTLKRIQRFDKPVKPDLSRKTFAERLYERALYPIVDRLIPRSYTTKRKKLDELIKGSISRMNLKSLFTKRILYGTMAFIFGVALFIALNINTGYRILHIPETPQGYLGGQLSEQEQQRLQAITDMDRRIVESLKKPINLDQLKEALAENGITDNASVEIAVNRILDKLSRIEDAYFKWYELLLCLVLFLAGYQMPIVSLEFLKSVRRIDMEEEVSQFQTIILMLMHMGRIHVEEILEWMEMFSINFKGPIQRCLLNFSSGSSEALERLKEDVAFPPLELIIENLQLANEELGVQRAFEELENEMTFNQEKRKQLNEHIVESKKNLGNMIGFMPVYALIGLYLMIPMILSGLENISAFYKQISGF